MNTTRFRQAWRRVRPSPAAGKRGLLALAAAAVLLAPAALAPAQDKPKDDALDKLLQKLEDSKPREAAKPGDVKPEDRDLDRLLKRLGETTETPAPSGRPPVAGPMPDEPRKPAAPDARPDQVKKEDKPLDAHLEEILGRVKKKDGENRQQQQANDENSPLKEAIKKMEEVRQKLGESDTGEGTRKTEDQIVQELEQVLERMRQARQRGQGQGRRQMAVRQPGNQPGDQQNQNTQDPNRGVGEQMPKKPSVGQMLAGQKDTWGDLPPSLREEMENVFNTEMLPKKRDLIIRYYEAVAKKGRAAPGR